MRYYQLIDWDLNMCICHELCCHFYRWYLLVSIHYTMLIWPMSFKSSVVDGKGHFIPHNQYHGFWWPGDIKIQRIDNHGIGLGLPEDYGFSTRVNSLPPGQMATISQTTFWNTYSWMKSFVSWFTFHWNSFLRVQLTIFHHWYRWRLCAN